MGEVDTDKFLGALELGDTSRVVELAAKNLKKLGKKLPSETKPKTTAFVTTTGNVSVVDGAGGGNGSRYVPQYLGGISGVTQTMSGVSSNATIGHMAFATASYNQMQSETLQRIQSERDRAMQMAHEMRAQAEMQREESLRMREALHALRAQQPRRTQSSPNNKKLEGAVLRLALMVAAMALKNNDEEAILLAQEIIKELNTD